MTTPIPTRHVIAGQLLYGARGVVDGFPGDGGKVTKTASIRVPKAAAEADAKIKAYKADIYRKALAGAGDGAFVKTPHGIKPTIKIPAFRDGDDGTEPLGYGHIIVKGNSIWPFKILGPDCSELSEAEAMDLLYPGQLVMLRLEVKYYDGRESRGVTAYLQGVRVLGGGPRLENSYDEQEIRDLSATPDELPAYLDELAKAAPAIEGVDVTAASASNYGTERPPLPPRIPAADEADAAVSQETGGVPVERIPGPGPQGKADAGEEIPW